MAKDDRVGRILVGRYRMRRAIGAGAHGRVYLAEDLGRGGVHVAYKIVEEIVGGAKCDEADDVLRWFRHPNWADVTDGGTLGENASFQVTRYVPGKSLDAIEGQQSAEFVWQFLEDGARVLGALHRQGLIHYDVTPGNWLLHTPDGKPQFVLTDGGLAHMGAVSGFARGTPQFMAPEVTESGTHDHRADLYSLGLVAFRLATGRDPIEGGGGDVLGRRRREEAPRASKFNAELPEALDDLLADLLARDPNVRPHDAFALLERIGKHVERQVPLISDDEGIAAAGGGPLVGRESELARFKESLDVLVQRLPENGRNRPRPSPVVQDAVLLLRGTPGTGTSRLATEMAQRARNEGMPVILMSGRETARDRRGPLRHLVDGLSALGLKEGEDAPRVELELDGERVGLEERSHAAGRAIEQLVQTVEAAAKRTPFVLVIEDLADLPQRAREAVTVLSRHLLSRRESSGGTSALTMTMIVDAGSAAHEDLLIPDSQDPERPILELASLDGATLKRLCTSRFVGLACDQADLERVLKASEGQPATLVSLLGEACRRGDLRSESGRWLWNVDDLDEYEIERGLSPIHADALRRADDRLVELLRYLSMVESAFNEHVMRALWGEGAFPATPLIQTWARTSGPHYALANLAVRKAVQRHGSTATWTDLRRRLVDALNANPTPATALDRARLYAALADHAEAMRVLEDNWQALSSESRTLAQPLVAAAVDADDTLLTTPEGRALIASLLEFGSTAVPVAKAVAERLTASAEELGTASTVSEVLENGRVYDLALGALERFARMTADSTCAATLWSRVANLQFELQLQTDGQESLRCARQALRKLRHDRAARGHVLALYLMTASRNLFLSGRTWRARLSLNASLKAASAGVDASVRVRLLNNLGIVCQQAGDIAQARAHFEASLNERSALGDVEGVIKTTINLGRLAQFEGELVRSASLYQSAASIALRHAQNYALVNALRALASVYDQQLNSQLAATTLHRAVKVGRRVKYSIGVLSAAWELAPLAAAVGDLSTAREMLAVSADAARAHTTEYARGTHALVSVLTNLHMGLHDRAAVYAPRLLRHRDKLFLDNQHAADSMLPLLGVILGRSLGPSRDMSSRPTRGHRTRFLHRAGIWMARALRDCTTPPPVPIRRFVPELGRQPSAPGRDRRVLIEMVLLAARMRSESEWTDALASVERHLAHTGERVILARTLAIQSARSDTESMVICAQKFSRAVDLLSAFATDRIPLEHDLAARVHTKELGTPLRNAPIAHDLHACAHRLLVAAGCTAAPDGRVASALRRVLEATGRLNAGAGLDELLEALTKHTTEITGAERACIVLSGQENELHVRVASDASEGHETLAVEDLSHTVIHRVLESSEPLLLHDVFDDQELMGRPSITSLSLRSILCVPMLRGDSMYGVMYADSASAAGSFDQVDLEVLSLFAEQAAAALETHRLVADLQNSMAELKAMQERLVRGERLRTMGELSSGVAHEFNNLLTSILARVQLIGLTQLDPDLRHDLTMIERACMDAAEVVRRLQSYAKQQRQRNFELLDMADICRDSIEFLRPLWTGRRRHGRSPIQVRLRATDGLQVMGNATELREVITNLVKNALDAITEDGGEITVFALVREAQVLVAIRDDGPGVPYEIQAKIFDPFYTTKGERGTGLGLALSQQIVERHGGELNMDSTPGVGTTMHVAIPTADSTEAKPAEDVAADELGRSDVAVLVVDDDENVLLPLCKYLDRAGYKAIPARSGEEGLSAVDEHDPDIVISDVGMPGMDGLELCRRLRTDRPSLPVVLMSGWAGSADPPRATQAGAVALLSKPFALRQVSELIDAVRAESA